MALGTSLFLIAVGAILRFAVTVSAHGLNIHTIGTILIVVGVVGLIISLLFMFLWNDRRRTAVSVDGVPADHIPRERL